MAHIKILECAENYQEPPLKDYFIARLNGALAKNSNDLYKQLKDILELPDYFGNNLDALYDCMMDFDWIVQENIVLIIEQFDELLIDETNDPDFIDDFVLLLDEVGLSWQMADDELFTPKKFSTLIIESEKAIDTCEDNEIEYEFVVS